jgi:alkylation response protein AidB-like acyl-CoA dehydrogenase
MRQGDHYAIGGSKAFITDGQTAIIVIVVAKTDPWRGAKGISLIWAADEPKTPRGARICRRSGRNRTRGQGRSFQLVSSTAS